MTGKEEVSHVADKEKPEREKMQEEVMNSPPPSQPPPAQARAGAETEVEPDPARTMTGSVEAVGRMSDAERERRYKRFFGEGEEVSPLRAILESPWGAKLWGARVEGYGLGILHQAREDRLRKEKEEASRRKDKDPPETIQGEEEEQVNSPSPETIQGKEQVNSPPPEPERETIQVDEEQGNSHPPPPSSEQPKAQWSWSPSNCWVTFPNKEDNPATWITDEYGEWRPRSAFTLPPYYRDPDPEARYYFDDMAEFYLEAARRLPIAEMPELAGFLPLGGLLLGLSDPVTNIIVNAIYFMGNFRHSDVLPHGADPVRHATDKASYVHIARRSRASLVVFMVFYFRHLTEAQAKRYLHAARHDLALAIGLVEWHRRGGFGTPSDLLDDLSPECSRTKTAFRYAAQAANENDLVRLLASRFPCHLLDPVLDDLRRGEQLSLGRVNDILNLLQNPWTPPPPLPAPTPGTFRDADGNVTVIANIGQDLFSTTTIKRDCAAAFNNNQNGGFITATTISRHPSRGDDDDLAAGTAYLSTDTVTRLRSFLSTTSALQLPADTKSLKMHLVDTIHGWYIQALAMLPSDHQPRLLRAMVAGGNCYGVMDDPVSNILVNSIWYNAHYPHLETADGDDDTLIKATRFMTRAESSSLHGLIAILRAGRGITEQEAVACLCKNSHQVMTSSLNQHSLAAAAEAAKYPQPAALVAFLTTLLTPEKRDRLCSLLTAKRVLSDADFKELNTMIAGDDVPAAPVQRITATPDPGQSGTVGGFGTPTTSGFNTVPAAPVQRMSPDRRLQSYVCRKVEELLLDHGLSNPMYKLGLICGVASMLCSSYIRGTTCFHVNFLASTPADVATTSPPECKLFFAEFWNQADDDFERSKKPPVCCPIQDYDGFPGRCFICERSTVWIVHPPCGNYFMGHQCSTESLCAVAEQHADLGQ